LPMSRRIYNRELAAAQPDRIIRSGLASFPLEMTEAEDLKSAGRLLYKVLYKRSPECSKTPQNAMLQLLSHNNIRKTGSIRDRLLLTPAQRHSGITQALRWL